MYGYARLAFAVKKGTSCFSRKPVLLPIIALRSVLKPGSYRVSATRLKDKWNSFSNPWQKISK